MLTSSGDEHHHDHPFLRQTPNYSNKLGSNWVAEGQPGMQAGPPSAECRL